MFKLTKSNVENNAKSMHRSLLRKASIVGASALMLLGAGAGITSYTPNCNTADFSLVRTAHADSDVPSIEEMWGHNDTAKQSGEEEMAEGRAAGARFAKDGTVIGFKGDKQVQEEDAKDGNEAPNYSSVKKDIDAIHPHKYTPKTAKQGKNAKAHVKYQIKRQHKDINKKHMSNKALRKQIASLKKELHRLTAQIKKLEGKAGHKAKKHVKKLTKQYKTDNAEMNKLSGQLKKSRKHSHKKALKKHNHMTKRTHSSKHGRSYRK